MVRLSVEYKLSGSIAKDISDVAWYRGFYRAVHIAQKDLGALDVTVILVDNPRIKDLNTAYRNHAKVTDVLSFRYDEEDGSSGELFISIPVAITQAKRYKHSLKAEMARLVVHGLFHLYGYDHMKSGERLVMRTLEKKALAQAKEQGLW